MEDAVLVPPLSVAPVHPTAAPERISTLDETRGLAVLGILLINIQSFSMISQARWMPLMSRDSLFPDSLIWLFTHTLAEGRFMALFSLLFGAGIWLMSERLESRGCNPAPVHFRRMGCLLACGILHSYLLWDGDILYCYGICGALVWSFRRCFPERLLLYGFLALMVGSVGSLALEMSATLAAVMPHISPTAERLAMRAGWLEQMYVRVPRSLYEELVGFWLATAWRVGGTMLCGISLLKSGFLKGELPRKMYGRVILWAGCAALVAGISACNVYLRPESLRTMIVDYQINYWTSPVLGIAWAAGAILLVQSRSIGRYLKWLEALGRTAFSNYILQTVICTTVFYGHGFGMFDRMSRGEQLGIVVAMWVFEAAASVVWISYFAFGPLEWLLRFFAYREQLPRLRLRDVPAA